MSNTIYQTMEMCQAFSNYFHLSVPTLGQNDYYSIDIFKKNPFRELSLVFRTGDVAVPHLFG